jgi:hypothetical protein
MFDCTLRARTAVLLAAASAVLAGSAAFADQATSEDVRVQQLEAKITALEAKQAQNNQDVAATIDAVLRDAEHRSQLLAAGGEAGGGYDNGFYIHAGDWTLRPGIIFQFRSVTDFRENTSPSGKDQTDNGFEVRRMIAILEGTALTRDLSYFFRWNAKPDVGQQYLEEAWAKWMFSDQYGAKFGQIKQGFWHEWTMSDGRQLAAERSMVNLFLAEGTVGRTQGAALIYGNYDKSNPLYAEVGFTDGANQLNTDFVSKTDSATLNGPHFYDFGAYGRVDYKVMGNWGDYNDFTAKGTKQDLLVIGAGVDWSQRGDGDQIAAAADAQWESTWGLGIYGGLLYRYLNSNIAGDDSNDWGLLIQAGYLLNPSWEVFGRWDFVKFDNTVAFAPGNDEDWFNELTIGVNYFLGNDGSALHRAKFTVDLSYLPDGTPSPLKQAGYTGDNSGHNEWALRAQFQLML